MVADPAVLPSASEFLCEAPLYTNYAFDLDKEGPLFSGFPKFDAFCLGCAAPTTYSVTSRAIGPEMLAKYCEVQTGHYASLTAACARNDSHRLRVWFRFQGRTVRKVGQWPSLADISTKEFEGYRKILGSVDGPEFHRALGLAAHGVGIGAFVYLRRILERLVLKRFALHKGALGCSAAEFNEARFPEKIDLLKDHLPTFLVENRVVYGILSAGIHALSEEECRKHFDLLRLSITTILDEEIAKKKEDEKKSALRKALADLNQDIRADKGKNNVEDQEAAPGA